MTPMNPRSTMLARSAALLALLVASDAYAQSPSPQIIMHGQAARAASLSGDPLGQRAIYVFWDASEGRLSELLPADASLTLERDGVVVLGPFSRDAIASAADIRARYAAPTEARRQLETMTILDLAFETAPGQSPLPDLPPDVEPTAATFPDVLAAVLADPRWDPVTSLLMRHDPNVAFAARRAYIEPITATTPASITFTLEMTTPGQARPTELGRVVIDTTVDYRVGAPSRFAAVTDGLFRCDSNDWSRAHGAVALTWDHPGLQNQASYLDALLASIPLAGYDLFAKTGPCEAQIDLASLAAATPFGPGGVVTPNGWRKVNERLASIQSPAPLRVPDTSPEYVSTWQPRFAQTLELPAALGPLGLLPGSPVCYAAVARDRTGNYGQTATLSTVVGDFQPPEIPWNLSVVTVAKLDYDQQSGVLVDEKALALEWPHVDLDNWLWSFASTYTPCNEAEARSGPRKNRLTIAEGTAGCGQTQRRSEVMVDVAEYLVYRFESAHVANAFADSDGDGIADADERLYDLDGDRVGDTPESSVDPEVLGSLPASDPALACEAAPTAGPALVATVPASATVASEDGRQVLRWSDPTPTQDLGEAYWYRVAARGTNGRLSRLSPPIRAAFYDMTKPPPFELGPGGDAGFFACEPTTYQDDSPSDGLRDGVVDPDTLFSPVGLDLPPLEDGGRLRGRRVMAVDLSGQATQMRLTCIDTELEKRAADSGNPLTQREATAMRMSSYVGTFDETARLNSNLAAQLVEGSAWPADQIVEGARVVLADEATFEGVCSALTEKAFQILFRADGDGGFVAEAVERCTPHVELLDAEGRSLAPPAPVQIRVDDSFNAINGQSCSTNPFAPGCLQYACNFVATTSPEVCERRLDEAPGLVTGKVLVKSRLDRGECSYLEAMQEFPVVDAQGQTSFELQPYRVGWTCCNADAQCNVQGGSHCCEVEQEIDPGDFGAEQTCYSVTRVHNTAAGAPNTLASTRTGGPCIKRAFPPAIAKAPTPPRLTELVTDEARVATLVPSCSGADCPCPGNAVFIEDRCVPRTQVGVLLWSSPETPTAGAILEYGKEGGAPDERVTRYVSTRGRYGAANPKVEPIDLKGPVANGTVERWCLTARSVGVSAPSKPEQQVSPATNPLCVERRPPGVALPEYLPWPSLPRATKLGVVSVEYLAADGIPFVSLAELSSAALPTRSWAGEDYDPANPFDDNAGCQRMTDCGCRPARSCDPGNPENECLARPTIVPSVMEPLTYSVDTDVYTWPPNHAEVHSRCFGLCSEVAQKNSFANAVAYRRSRTTANPSELGPFVQVSEHMLSAHCFFSRQQFRQWRPLVSREGASRFGLDDPNFAVLDMERSGSSGRTTELVWLDRHPHMVGRDYQYQFVFFDERGEVRGYKESNWIVYRQSGPPTQPRHYWVPEDAP